MSSFPELLAPAGGPAELAAALQAGANAVYFGLKKLNARTGAKNFAPEELADTVRTIHDAHAKAYLTLNIDLSQRELGLALRTLALAHQSGVDAVLIRDAALLPWANAFPGMDFHFSTQAAVSSSAGVQAAKFLGITRTVLARELSGEEMKAASAVPGMEIEVFVQGALCFSCSGRCLLSSWVGGRSGNRGACASPCRVKWTCSDGITSTPLSMHDFCLVKELPQLAALGIASLKIEGRLKSASWVSRTVSLYRQALDNAAQDPAALDEATEALGAYAGRQLSNAYFYGIRSNVTGESARPAGTCQLAGPDCQEDAPISASALIITSDDTQGTCWNLRVRSCETSLRTPPQRVANPKRAITVETIAAELSKRLSVDGQPADVLFDPPELSQRLLPKSAGNRLLEDTEAFLRKLGKQSDGVVRDVALPAAIKQALDAPKVRHPENKFTLGDAATLYKVTLEQAKELLQDPSFPLSSHKPFIIDCSDLCETTDVQAMIQGILSLGDSVKAVSLPAVLYENDLEKARQAVKLLAPHLLIEVNSWDGWWLAKQAHARMVAGPGMAVLNAWAAKFLHTQGCQWATLSCEMDSDQLQALSASAETPLALVIFAYLPLMQTRAELPDGFRENTLLSDGRNVTLRPHRRGSTTLLTSTTPLDWRKLKNPNVCVSQLIIDLTGAEDLKTRPAQTSLFNYDRRLR